MRKLIAILILAGLIVTPVLFLLLAWWQFADIGPTTELSGGTEWWRGFVHGFFVLPNFVFSLFTEGKTIFQAGGGGWYAFWWLVGAGGVLAPKAMSSSSKRS